ncbi:hypothetical protein PAHAL_6G256300 [Panicum hallii]|uniref:Uncharacterized protein n=1 Tax=Panicum hallii TaxID=206008 RepID=A0A2S3I3P2_9POAL|nr:hypothetical protein PAHAL_6G256300 [Panicum hallii]
MSSSSLQRDAALTSETPWPGPIVAGGGGGGGVLPPDHHRPAMLIPGDFGTKSIKALQGMLEGLSDSVVRCKANRGHAQACMAASFQEHRERLSRRIDDYGVRVRSFSGV